MRPEISIIPTTVEHIRMLVADLREDDRREVEKWKTTPFKGIWRSYRNSKVCRTGFINGKIVAIFGINGSVLGYVGNPWVMTSNAVEEYPFVFASLYRREVKEMLKSYKVLESWVDASYTKSIKLMNIIGFREKELVALQQGGKLVRLEMIGA